MDDADLGPPPYNVEIEQALLGHLLIHPRLIEATGALLDPEHFFDPLHERLFRTILKLGSEGTVSPLTVAAVLREDVGLREVGGHDYLASLAEASPGAADIPGWARLLRILAVRRAMENVGNELLDLAHSDISAEEMDERAEMLADRLHAARHGASMTETLRPFHEHLEGATRLSEAAKRDPTGTYLSWGLASLDEAIGPLFRTDLTVLGAATSMAKTALAQHVFESAGRAARPMLMFSLEMPGNQLGMRTLAQSIRVPSNRIRRGTLSTQEFEGMVSATHEWSTAPVYIDDKPRQTVAEMRAKASIVRRRHGDLACVIVDHLQFVGFRGDQRLSPADRLDLICQDLKVLANELNTAVLLISHITKDNERRESKRPTLSDLHGSSGIQKNADCVVFIYREHYYLVRNQPEKTDEKAWGKWLMKREAAEGWAEIYSEKNRLGKVGIARVRFDERFTRFSDPEPDSDAQPNMDWDSLSKDLKG